MPPPMLVNPSEVDCSRVAYTRAQIYAVLPQRYEFAQLDGIVRLDVERRLAIGFRDVRTDEWWCRGHMPRKPIFPGVLMVECAAQLAACATHFVQPDVSGFVGFGGIDQAKFRDAVEPPARIVLACRGVDIRPRRIICETQAYLKGTVVFEATITGLRLQW
jgi:3-hydroxyacyl-[acyl-carrier-protein] dehydratase